MAHVGSSSETIWNHKQQMDCLFHVTSEHLRAAFIPLVFYSQDSTFLTLPARPLRTRGQSPDELPGDPLI